MAKKLTYKDYMSIFDISCCTARRWISEDRREIGSKRLTIAHIRAKYGLEGEYASML